MCIYTHTVTYTLHSPHSYLILHPRIRVCTHDTLTLSPGNIVCRGANLLDQAESCHFERSSRDECGPPARVILEGNNISASPGGAGEDGFCECGFRGGALVCVTGELEHLASYSLQS